MLQIFLVRTGDMRYIIFELYIPATLSPHSCYHIGLVFIHLKQDGKCDDSNFWLSKIVELKT